MGSECEVPHFQSCFLMPLSMKALKVVSATFLLVCFVCLKESTRETRKCFLFHFESSFCSGDIQTLTFQMP